MARRADWRARLAAYLAVELRRPFAPGAADCARFADGAYQAITGESLGAGFSYRSLRGGLRVLKRAGFADHIAFAAHHLPEIPVAAAQAGDIAAVPGEGGLALGVVQGAAIYVRTASGVDLVPLTSAARAFRVL